MRTFLDSISEEVSSFLLFGDRVYSINASGKAADTLTALGTTLRLIPSLTYSDLETLDWKIQQDEIARAGDYFVRQTIRRDIESLNNLNNKETRLVILNFLINQFLPFFYSRKYPTHLPGDTEDPEYQERARQELNARLEAEFGRQAATIPTQDVAQEHWLRAIEQEKQELKQIERFPPRYAPETLGLEPTKIRPSFFGDLTDHQPLYVQNRQVYPLSLADGTPIKAAPQAFRFYLKGKDYVADKIQCDLATLSANLLAMYEAQLHINALESNRKAFDVIRQTLESAKTDENALNGLVSKESYDLGDCGFVVIDDNYYVYTLLPAFAAQDGRDPNRYWPFEPTRIAIKIGFSSGQPYSSDRAVSLDKRANHPCLSHKDMDKRTYDICILDRNPDGYGHELLGLVRKLSDGVLGFTHPLSLESLNSHPGHTYFGTTLDNILKQEPLTRQQALEQGLQVFDVMTEAEVNELNKAGDTNG